MLWDVIVVGGWGRATGAGPAAFATTGLGAQGALARDADLRALLGGHSTR